SGFAGCANPATPTPCAHQAPSPVRSSRAPSARSASAVRKTSSPSSRPEMRVSPTVSAAKISARCEIDLSPGTRRRPFSGRLLRALSGEVGGRRPIGRIARARSMRACLASSRPRSHVCGSVLAAKARGRRIVGAPSARPPRGSPNGTPGAIDSPRASRQGKHRPSGQVSRISDVAKPELGTKRLCANCGAKFYDLSKDPIVCPKCETVFVPPVAARARPEPVAPVAPAAAAAAEEEVRVREAAGAGLIPLEEAEKETGGTGAPAAEGGEEEVEVDDEALDDAAFIVPEEEDEEDVTDIIGEGIEDDEER